MASCRDRTSTGGPMPPSKPNPATPHTEPATSMRDPASASRQVHLRQNYAVLGPEVAGRTAAAGDGHA